MSTLRWADFDENTVLDWRGRPVSPDKLPKSESKWGPLHSVCLLGGLPNDLPAILLDTRTLLSSACIPPSHHHFLVFTTDLCMEPMRSPLASIDNIEEEHVKEEEHVDEEKKEEEMKKEAEMKEEEVMKEEEREENMEEEKNEVEEDASRTGGLLATAASVAASMTVAEEQEDEEEEEEKMLEEEKMEDEEKEEDSAPKSRTWGFFSTAAASVAAAATAVAQHAKIVACAAFKGLGAFFRRASVVAVGFSPL